MMITPAVPEWRVFCASLSPVRRDRDNRFRRNNFIFFGRNFRAGTGTAATAKVRDYYSSRKNVKGFFRDLAEFIGERVQAPKHAAGFA